MASSKEYLEFILEQLSELNEITYRAMMGEYIIYYHGKIMGGIYDDRLLVKPVKSAISLMPNVSYELPYKGAKEMLLVDDVDSKDFLTRLFDAMYNDLPAPKKKIAFICVHNSCRSQIAEALGKHFASDVFESYSAGTETKPQINQDAVRLMKELYGIDMEKTQYSKLLAEIPKPDIAVSMGCNVSCPFIGRDFDDNWGLDDPTGKSDEEFKIIIKKIEEKVLMLKEKFK